MSDIKATPTPPTSVAEAPPKNLTLYWLTPFHQPYRAEVIGNPGGTIGKLKETIVKEKTKGWTEYVESKTRAGDLEHSRDWTWLQFYCPSPETYRAALMDSAVPSDHVIFIVSSHGSNWLDMMEPVWKHVSSGFTTFSSKLTPSLAGVLLSADPEADDDDDDEDDDDGDAEDAEEEPKGKPHPKGLPPAKSDARGKPLARHH